LLTRQSEGAEHAVERDPLSRIGCRPGEDRREVAQIRASLVQCREPLGAANLDG
jgi:hypothetical protein